MKGTARLSLVLALLLLHFSASAAASGPGTKTGTKAKSSQGRGAGGAAAAAPSAAAAAASSSAVIENLMPAGAPIAWRVSVRPSDTVRLGVEIWKVERHSRTYGALLQPPAAATAAASSYPDNHVVDSEGRVTYYAKLRFDDAAIAGAPSQLEADSLRAIREAVWHNKSLVLTFDVVPVGDPDNNMFHGEATITDYRRRSAVCNPRFLLDSRDAATVESIALLKQDEVLPVVASRIELNLVEDLRRYSAANITKLENFVRYWMHANSKFFQPITHVGTKAVVGQRLLPMNETVTTLEFELIFTPRSREKWEWIMSMEATLQAQIENLGSSDRELEQLKGMLLDTNVTLLYITSAVAFLHLFLDFLAFKNDISFWKNRKNLRGVSTSILFFNVMTQTVVLLYLLENETSKLVLVPLGIGLVVECWKILRSVTLSFSLRTGLSWRVADSMRDPITEEADEKAMRLVVRGLVPAALIYSAYSLVYHRHCSWYSWVISSLSSVVYALGFIRMMPQLFINYKLKSVAFLPWRAFTYKFLNTIIDDLFAFIIVMPTMHRVAAFRDDIIFLCFLYQRWIYPVDKTRVNEFGQSGDEKPAQSAEAVEKERSEYVPEEYKPVSEPIETGASVIFPLLNVSVDPRPTKSREGPDASGQSQPWRFVTGGGGGSAKTGIHNKLIAFDVGSSGTLFESGAFDADLTTVTCCAFHPSHDVVAVGTGSSIRLLTVSKGSLTSTLSSTPTGSVSAASSAGKDEHSSPSKDLSALAFTADGKLLVAADAGGCLRLWDAEHLKPLGFAELGERATSLSVSPDQRFVYACCPKRVTAWSLADLKKQDGKAANSLGSVSPSLGGTAMRGARAFDDAGKSFLYTGEMTPGKRSWLQKWEVSASVDGTGMALNLVTSRVSFSSTHHNDLAISPDGKWLATCTSNGEVAVHSAKYLHTVMELKRHDFFITSVAFSPDSATLVSAGADHAVRCTPVTVSHELPIERRLLKGLVMAAGAALAGALGFAAVNNRKA